MALDSTNWNPSPSNFSTQTPLTKEMAIKYYGGERNPHFIPKDEPQEQDVTILHELKTTKEMLEELIAKERSTMIINNYAKNPSESYQVNYMVYSPGAKHWRRENPRITASVKMLSMAAIALQFNYLHPFPRDFVKNVYSKWQTPISETLDNSIELAQKKDFMGFADKKKLGS